MTHQHPHSEALFREAERYFPGGVNSPVRAFRGVGGTPLFFKRGEGPRVWDEDDRSYIDYVGSWGPAILGHTNPQVVKAVQEAAALGLSFGAPTAAETELARAIQDAFPVMASMRFVASGTEACMSALRVARGATGRNRILKFSGCYHGHADMLLVQAGSGVATLGIPGCPGIPPGATQDTVVLPYNDLEAVRQLFTKEGAQFAAIILEPMVGNAGFIRPAPGFLKGLRELCTQHGALLIFDEVMTGFRVAYGGVCAQSGVEPDLVTLGKIVGGGLPLAVYGGKREVMAHVAPSGGVYQAGTLAGNPVAVAAGLATLRQLKLLPYAELCAKQVKLVSGFRALAAKYRIPFIADGEGGMFGFFFGLSRAGSYEEAQGCDQEAFRRFFWGMLERGVYLAPSSFEACFVSFAHGDDVLTQTLDAADAVLKSMTR